MGFRNAILLAFSPTTNPWCKCEIDLNCEE